MGVDGQTVGGVLVRRRSVMPPLHSARLAARCTFAVRAASGRDLGVFRTCTGEANCGRRTIVKRSPTLAMVEGSVRGDVMRDSGGLGMLFLGMRTAGW